MTVALLKGLRKFIDSV